ncbi:RidA family protein [Candidatus Atribacteria bacterium HGW-Atribacteria-1]|nr:MAG: RidA family protein [Candidatus Atribacteria bacterium HGW-Atribacteria-1]
MGEVEKRLKDLNIKLVSRDRKGKGLIPLRQVGNLLFLSGHGCNLEDGSLIYEGKLGKELTVDQGYEAARQVGINLLSTLKDYLGDLSRVERIIKALGFVASTPEFYQQPAVMHGFSDLMTEVFGEIGQHARSAIGTNVLPKNQPVEIELIVQIRD